MSFAPPSSLESTTQDKILGALIVLAVLALGYVYYLSANARDSGKWYVFNAVLTDSYGITMGTVVKYKGIAIGSVHALEVNEAGQIDLEVWLKQDFARLYVRGSKLVVDSTIGIGNVLSGSSLLFESALRGPALESGQSLEVSEPKNLTDLLAEFNVEQLASQVSNILQNLDAVITTLSANQDNINRVMDNMSDMTDVMLRSSGQFPALLTELESTLADVKQTVRTTNTVIENNAVELAALENSSAELLQSMSVMVNKTTPLLDEFPATIHNLNGLLSDAKLLTVQLRHHWLFGDGGNTPKPAPPPILIRYPLDQSLYHPDAEPAQKEQQIRGNLQHD